MKKLISLLMVLVLAMSLTGAVAEGLNLDMWAQYQVNIKQLNNTNYVIVTEKFTHYQSIYTSTGELVATFPYTNLTYSNYGLFTAYNEDDVNSRALVQLSGAEITDPAYGAFVTYNAHWAVGYVLEPATEENNNYKRGKDFFNIVRYDVYYISDTPAKTEPIAQLTPEQFKSADVHGDYIAIMDVDEKVTLYDKTFKAYDLAMDKPGTAVYGVVDYAIIDKATGDIVLDGFTAVKEQKMSDGLWLIGTRYNFKGQQISGIIDLEGKEIMPVDYFITTVTDKYVVITNPDKLKGLYSLETGKIIVPCEFNNIMVGKVSTDNYVHNGYVAVENGDLRGYYDVNAGKLSCEVKYDRTAVTTIGCSTFWQVEEGVYMLVAADGVETEVHVDEISKNTRGNGHLLVAKKDGMFGVIDWHGNVVLPFEHNKQIIITDDSQALIRTSTGMQIDRLSM